MSISNSGNSPDIPHGGSTEEIRRELLTGAQHLSSQVRTWAWWRGFALWLGVIVLTFIGLLLVDIALRREEIGLRFLSLTLFVASAGWAWMRFLRPLWSLSPTPVQLAQWIERSRPDLGERLSTAIQIAQTSPSEERYGSVGFRDAVLRSWSAETHKPNWSDYLDTKSSWRAFAWAALMLLLFSAGLLVRPMESRLAITRLLLPWTAHHWPRRDQLEFKDFPTVIGRGSELQLEVFDLNPPLPGNVLIHLRKAGEADHEIFEIPTTELDDVAIGNLPAIEEAIEVRATGGDDQNMPWQRIAIVTPPSLESYQFNIEPPAYAARPSSALVGTRIQVLSRSQVAFTGTFDEPVESAKILLANESQAADEQAAPNAQDNWVSQLSSDSQTLRIANRDGQPAELMRSLAWRIEIVTRDGLRLELPQRWSIEVVDDTPPTVALNTPLMNQIAADGQLALRGQAIDDLGLADISAQLQIEGSEAEAIIHPIWSNPGDNTHDFLVDTRWDFAATLAAKGIELREGQVISIWLEARDHLGQTGRSQTERLEIQSSENLLTKVQERQNQLLKNMREMVEAQRRNQQLTARTKQALDDARRVSQAEVDSLAGVAQNQEALSEQLSEQKASLLDQVAEIESLLEMNRLSDSLLAEQMKEFGRDIGRIAEGKMQQAVTDTSTAFRETRLELSEDDFDTALLEQVEQAEQSQGEVVEAMQTLADRLNRSGGLQQVQREFTAISNQQQSLIRDTEALQIEQLRGARPEQNAAQRAIADDQLALAQQLDALLKRTQELSSGNTPTDSSGLIEQLSQATEAITRGEVSRMMRQAAEETNAEQLTNALDSQRKAAEVLTEALRPLDSTQSPAAAQDLKALADSLQATSEAIAELADSQSQLAEQMRQPDSASRADELSEQQASLSNQTEQQSEKARSKGEQPSADALQAAMQEQAAAEQATEQKQMPSAATAAERAATQLEQLAEEMQERAQELERQSAQQQLYRLEVALTDLLELQSPVVDRLNTLAEQQATAGLPTETETEENEASARQAAADQEAVRMALRQVQQQSQQLSTFHWMLEQTSSDMGRAAAAALRYRIDPEAVTAANDALKKLELANEALESQQTPNDAPESELDEQASDEANANDDQQQVLPPVASLKLLRGLQNEINQQTLLLDSELDANRKSRRLRELSEQQQALGTQLEVLLESLSNQPQSSNGN